MILAILQARLGSTRLPGKTLALIQGRPMLSHVISRLHQAKTIDRILVATTTNPEDGSVEKLAESEGVACYRGSVNDVLDRFYQAARSQQATLIVRITADCPLLEPEVVDEVVRKFQEGGFDYVSNTNPPTYPDGLDTEVFSFAALERAWKEARLPSEREHVTPYIWKTPGRFRLGALVMGSGRDLSAMRWTVDEPQDLEFVRRVYAALGEKGRTHRFHLEDVLEAIRKDPSLSTLNQGIDRNEGYARSLREDPGNSTDK